VYLKTCISPALERIRLRQTEFSIYLVEQLSSIQFNSRIFELRTVPRYLAFLLVVSIIVIDPTQLLVGVSCT